jgi:pimeloyl-ACP methyl ester carboxylesterase
MPDATNDGLRIHYEVAGGGEPLVLYHGLTGSGDRWRDTGHAVGRNRGVVRRPSA